MNRSPLLHLALLSLAACGTLPTGPIVVPATLTSTASGLGDPSATLPPDAPDWVTKASSHPSYPASKYMSAVGISNARDPAEEDGRKNLSEELRSKIEAETEVFVREVAVNDDIVSSLDHTGKVRNRSSALLHGSRAVDEYRYAGTVYVLVALDREKHASTALEKIDSDLSKLGDSASGTRSLRALIEEHAILTGVTEELINVGLVLPKGHPMRAEFERRMGPTRERVKAVLAEYSAQGVTIRPVSGNGQKGYPGQTLAERMVFEVQAGGRPVVGFPVQFSLEYPGKAELLEADRQTDPKGRFACAVTGIQLTGDEENTVTVSLDYASLGEEVLQPPSCEVSFLLPTMKSATFSIAIKETNISAVAPESVVQAAIEAGLGKRGAKLIALGAFLSESEAREAATASPAWLQRKLGDRIDYLIRGTARSVASSSKGSIVFTYAGGDFELIDVRTGQQVAAQTLAPSSGSGPKGTGNGDLSSGARALKKLGEQIKEEFMAKIDKVFLVE